MSRKKDMAVQEDLNQKLQSLRDSLRKQDVLDRIIDLFRKFDVDQNGAVDLKEFTNAIMEILPHVRGS